MHKALYTYCNINFVALVCYPHILHKKEFLSLLNNLQLSCEYISLRNVTLDINTVNPFQPNDAVHAMDWKGLIFYRRLTSTRYYVAMVMVFDDNFDSTNLGFFWIKLMVDCTIDYSTLHFVAGLYVKVTNPLHLLLPTTRCPLN